MSLKKFCKILSIALCIAFLIATFSCFASQKSVTISDDFESKSTLGGYSMDNFTLYGDDNQVYCTELKKPNHAISFEGKNVTGETNILITDWYKKIDEISYDLFVPDTEEWFAMDFIDIDKPSDYLGDYSEENGNPMIYDSYKLYPTMAFMTGMKWTQFGFETDSIKNQWVSVKVVADSQYSATIYMAPKGKKFTEEGSYKFTVASPHSFYNSALVLADYKFVGYVIDNVVLKTFDGTVKEDFEDENNDLFKELKLYSDSVAQFPIVDYDGDRRLLFDNTDTDTALISNTEITQLDENFESEDVVLDVAFDIDYTSAKGDLAYVFAMPAQDESPFCENYGVVFSKGSAKLCYFEMDGVGKTFKSGKISNTAKVEIVLQKSGKLTLNADGKEVFSYNKIENYEGFTGFAVKSGIKGKLYIDNLCITNNYYEKITTKNLSEDFSVNHLSKTGNSDYVYHEENGTIKYKDGELWFDGVVDGTYFGPAYKYETYELTFKMTSILKTEKESERTSACYADDWIGLDFGKNTPSISSYGSYGMIAISVDQSAGVDLNDWDVAGCFGYKNEASPLNEIKVTRYKDIPSSLFKNIYYDGVKTQKEDISASNAVCFKYVASTDKIDVYLKKASDKEYTLYLTVDGISPEGYLALCCTGFEYWTIDDFEIINTAKVYNEAAEVAYTEEDVTILPLTERGIGVEDTGFTKEQELNAENTVEKANGNNKILLYIIIGAGAVLVLCAAAFIIVKRLKKSKEGAK